MRNRNFIRIQNANAYFYYQIRMRMFVCVMCIVELWAYVIKLCKYLNKNVLHYTFLIITYTSQTRYFLKTCLQYAV